MLLLYWSIWVNLARRQSSQFTCQSMFQPWSITKSCGYWLKVWDCKYKLPKLVSLAELLDSALEIKLGARTAGESSGCTSPYYRRSRLWWFGYMVMRGLLLDVFLACPAGRRPQWRPRTQWRYYLAIPWALTLHIILEQVSNRTSVNGPSIQTWVNTW